MGLTTTVPAACIHSALVKRLYKHIMFIPNRQVYYSNKSYKESSLSSPCLLTAMLEDLFSILSELSGSCNTAKFSSQVTASNWDVLDPEDKTRVATALQNANRIANVSFPSPIKKFPVSNLLFRMVLSLKT